MWGGNHEISAGGSLWRPVARGRSKVPAPGRATVHLTNGKIVTLDKQNTHRVGRCHPGWEIHGGRQDRRHPHQPVHQDHQPPRPHRGSRVDRQSQSHRARWGCVRVTIFAWKPLRRSPTFRPCSKPRPRPFRRAIFITTLRRLQRQASSLKNACRRWPSWTRRLPDHPYLLNGGRNRSPIARGKAFLRIQGHHGESRPA